MVSGYEVNPHIVKTFCELVESRIVFTVVSVPQPRFICFSNVVIVHVANEVLHSRKASQALLGEFIVTVQIKVVSNQSAFIFLLSG